MKEYEKIDLQLDELNMDKNEITQQELDIWLETDELNDISFVNELVQINYLNECIEE